MDIFQYIVDKDLFEVLYSGLFAQRYHHSLYVQEAEKTMILKLEVS